MTVRALPGSQIASTKAALVGFVTNPTMEATDEALAQKEQEAAYMVDGEM